MRDTFGSIRRFLIRKRIAHEVTFLTVLPVIPFVHQPASIRTHTGTDQKIMLDKISDAYFIAAYRHHIVWV
jgi:hypothetical protein